MMQLLWMGLGVLIGFIVLTLDTDVYEVGAPLFYGAMMVLLMVTIVIAPDIKGSRSWLVLGPVRLQPAEFAKVATALTLAWLFNQYEFTIKSTRSYLKIFGFGIGFPCTLLSPLSRRLLWALHGTECSCGDLLHWGTYPRGYAVVGGDRC